LEISHNNLATHSLETLGYLFSRCPHLQKLNLSSNLLGASSDLVMRSISERQSMDFFLLQLMTELDCPQELDLSHNMLTEESVLPLVKYLLANYECKLKKLRLSHN
jgi:Ran GTPase-activating protein (RanGAP) involved in mRNA processing and transport